MTVASLLLDNLFCAPFIVATEGEGWAASSSAWPQFEAGRNASARLRQQQRALPGFKELRPRREGFTYREPDDVPDTHDNEASDDEWPGEDMDSDSDHSGTYQRDSDHAPKGGVGYHDV